jgi:hypothetical protein
VHKIRIVLNFSSYRLLPDVVVATTDILVAADSATGEARATVATVTTKGMMELSISRTMYKEAMLVILVIDCSAKMMTRTGIDEGRAREL